MKRVSIIKQPVLSVLNAHVVDYPSPSNINVRPVQEENITKHLMM